MGKAFYNTVNFTSGEWSARLDARIDQPKYAAAQRKCQNLIPYKTGGLTRRPGTKYIANCKYQDTDTYQYAARLMPFQFSPTTSFMLEFGHHYIRFYSNEQQVVVSSAPLYVYGVQYAPGDYVEDASDGNAIYYCLNYNSTLPGPPKLEPLYWAKQNILEVPTPYNGRVPQGPSIFGCDVWTITPCQINDVVYLVHPDYPPYKLTRVTDTHWTMVQVAFLAPALLDQNATDTTISSSGTTGSVTLTATAPAWATATFYSIGNSVLQAGVIYECIVGHNSGTFATDLAAGYWEVQTIFQSGHIGSTWQLAYLVPGNYLEVDGVAATGFVDGTSSTISAIGAWNVYTAGVWSSDIALQQSVDNGNNWTTIRTMTSRSDKNFAIDGTASVLSLFRFVITNSAALVTPGATKPRVVFEVVDGFRYGVVEISAVASAYSASAVVLAELYSTGATLYWSEAAWSELRGYPRAITAYQQRVIYGATAYEPQRIWGTRTDDLENFALGDQTKADDSFAFDLAAVGRGAIQWLIGQVDLFAGFSGAEWIINAGQGSFGGSTGPITPTSINAGEHSAWGSASGIPPAIVGNAVVYTQRSAQTLQQMMFSVYTNKYMSADLTVLSEHLFSDGIVQIAYQPLFRTQGIIWVTTQSGSLCGMTYQLEQDVFGWHRHITGQNSTTGVYDYFESVAVIDGQHTNDDEVWVVVDRINGRTVELMNPVNWETQGTPINGVATPDLTQAIYVDSSSTYSSPGSLTLTGLDRLEGRSVCGLADGNAFGPLTVTGGYVTLPSSIPTTVDTVQIGLPIPYIGQTMRIDLGPGGPTQSMIKSISDVYVRVFNSLGGAVSNNTAPYRTWTDVGTQVYAAGDNVVSPETELCYTCLLGVTGSPLDPSEDPTNWALIPTPSVQAPVPIPYANNPTQPFSVPVLVTTPKDIRITPQQMPWPNEDPIYSIIGTDAKPLTILALVLRYDITSTP